MKGHLRWILSRLSLLGSLVFLVLWAFSYRLAVQLEWDPKHGMVHDLTVIDGWFMYEVMDDFMTGAEPGISTFSAKLRRTQLEEETQSPHRLGPLVYSQSVQGSAGIQVVVVGIRIWLVILLMILMPMRRQLRRERRSAGSCRACGYDLRATSERCPECGAAVELA